MKYRMIQKEELTKSLFSHFTRHQVVTKCHRKIKGEWAVIDDPFVDDWSEEEYDFLIRCLKNTCDTNGIVYGAFLNKELKGFCSVESTFLGSKNEYLDLSCIHVSEECRGKGIGATLFSMAKNWAKEHGARKLYISAHSAVESQAFYHSQGCHEAEEYNQEHVQSEPCDCQIECVL